MADTERKRVSFSNIDIDAITLPDNDEPEPDPTVDVSVSTTPNAKSAKWDWNALFVPLKGRIPNSSSYFNASQTTNASIHSHHRPPSPRETQCNTSAASTAKYNTIGYSDESNGTAPWISDNYKNRAFLDRMHMELMDFCLYVSPTKHEHTMREELTQRITDIVLGLWPKAAVHVFGSMKTKLYLPTSDLDIAVFPNLHLLKSGAHAKGADCKSQLATALKAENMCSYLEIISTARVPLVKFTHAATELSVDICFDRESGVLAADALNELQIQYPALRPLTYFLKYFLWFRALNEPFRGGMGSYLLQMLIINLLQTHPIRSTSNWRRVDADVSLGGWLLAFFELYGKHFNYAELGISPIPSAHYFIKEERSMKLYDRPHLLCCECPFESTGKTMMDSGRNTYNIMKIKQSFEWALNTLLAHADTPRKSVLGLLVGIRGKMLRLRSKDTDKLLRFNISAKDLQMNHLLANTFRDEATSDDDEDVDDDDLDFVPLHRQNKKRKLRALNASTSTSSDKSDGSDSVDSSFTSLSASDCYYRLNDKGELILDTQSDSDTNSDGDVYHDSTKFQQQYMFEKRTSRHASGRHSKRKTSPTPSESTPQKSQKQTENGASESERSPSLHIGNHGSGSSLKRSHSVSNSDLNFNVSTPASKKRKLITKSALAADRDDRKKRKISSMSWPNLRTKSTPCFFYEQGHCAKGHFCTFQHGEDDRRYASDRDDEKRSGVCRHYQTGTCAHGQRCRWRHTDNPNRA